MIKDKPVFLITEDKNIVITNSEDGILARDQVVYKSYIYDLVQTELDEDCRDDGIEDYENILDFYLSNAIKESYKGYIKDRLDNVILTDEALGLIQDMVIERIKDRVANFSGLKLQLLETIKWRNQNS